MYGDVNKKHGRSMEISGRIDKKPGERKTIAFFDSGVGGIPYLQWLRERLHEENFVYLADRENFPYGEKDDHTLRELILRSVGRFIEKSSPDLMVIACNTASVVALAELRKSFDIPFVGVVPAIKPAAALSRQKSIGVLATRRTVEDPYTEGLIRRFAADSRVSLYPGVEIVELVENRLFTATEAERKSVLQPAVSFFLERGVDTLVVACTHFIFVQEELAEMMGDGTRVIDSREGVGRQVLRLMGKAGPAAVQLPASKEVKGRSVFYLSSRENHERYRNFAAAFDMEWGGVL